MNGIATTLTASILALGTTLPVRAFAPDEAEPSPDAPVETTDEKQGEDDALPSLDELLGLDEDESEASAAQQAQQEADEELQRRLKEVELGDIFSQALEKMALSVYLLEVDSESGVATQRAQQDVLEKLDQLIDRARELSQRHSDSCSGCSECSGGKPDSQKKPGDKPGSQKPGGQRSDGPASDGLATDPPAGREGDINTILEETGTEWGHLPSRIREMLKQGRGDYKSPLYRELTEEYYKRLAEEGSS